MPSRKRVLGVRRTMTPNQIVAYNLAKARNLRGWTQRETVEHLADYLGSSWSAASLSAVERSIAGTRIKQFSADELVAISRVFDLPLIWFFIPPPASEDIGLSVPDGGLGSIPNGVDPAYLLDVVFGTPENLGHLEQALADYIAGEVPPVRKGQNSRPPDLPDRLGALARGRARTVIESTLGDLGQARAILERLTALVDLLEDVMPDAQPLGGRGADEAVPPDTAAST